MASDGESLLRAPCGGAEPTRDFEAIYGGSGLLHQLAEAPETDPKFAEMLRGIADGLRDGTLTPPAPPEAQRRFIGYVYPVI